MEFFTPEQKATRENLDFWVDNMRRFHNFSWEEVAEVTGYSVEGIKEISKNLEQPIQSGNDVVTILPYPGGTASTHRIFRGE